jgi:hypothetical protein
MQRQGTTADIRFNLAVQKAMDPTEDPIEGADGGAYDSGQKADEDWGSGDRSESGGGGDSADDLLRMARKAEAVSSEVAKWGKPKGSAPQKAPAASTGFSLPARPKPLAPAAKPSLGFSGWPAKAAPGSQAGLNRAELSKALDFVQELSASINR